MKNNTARQLKRRADRRRRKALTNKCESCGADKMCGWHRCIHCGRGESKFVNFKIRMQMKITK